MKGNPMDIQAAKNAAKRLYQKINYSGGPLQSYQISTLLNDTYQYLKIPFKPTTNDIKTYTNVLDVNKDGQVTLADLENLAVQYLCGPGVLPPTNFDANYKKQKYQNSNPTTPSYQVNSNTSFGNIKTTVQSKFEQPTRQISNQAYNTYSQQVLHYLSITRHIFETHADKHFTITAKQVANVLTQTYGALGRKGYKPNEQDVKVWIKLCDGNNDGHVQYEQYEYFVVRSLQRSGITIYK